LGDYAVAKVTEGQIDHQVKFGKADSAKEETLKNLNQKFEKNDVT
jgi:hypothetical protein